jgi:4-amino-4-deoxy-L-arabinose transferase-like glycosyltransferase
MFRRLNCVPCHLLLIVLVSAALNLPNLGAASLWDIDEGNNAEAAREMDTTGDWVVPKFNGELRVDKPALLYWLQLGAYRLFGVNEFSARLPSALAAVAAALGVYALGRRMFGAGAGLLAALVFASSLAPTVAGHFANPDALLTACAVWTLFFFWAGFARGGRPLFVPMGACMGLAMLAKGPVGLLLPLAITTLFLLWSGRWRCLLDRRLLWGTLAFIVVMGPWYAWVATETKAEFLRGFFLTHNFGRFLSPMENHRGPFYYYAAVLPLGFLPWSVFLGLTAWYGLKAARGGDGDTPAENRLAVRLLWCWALVYFAAFSLAATKLPNYILPLYPPLALLTGWVLDRWRRGAIEPRAWALHLGLAGLGLVGVGLAVGLLLFGGTLPGPWAPATPLPRLVPWAAAGAVPVAGAALAWRCWQRRTAMVGALVATAVLFLGLLAAFGSGALEKQKAPRALAWAMRAAQQEPDVRVGCFNYFQPSLVFYSGREVRLLQNRLDVADFLRSPLQVFVFVPASVWDTDLRPQVQGSCRVLARRRDVYRNCDVVVVTNR